MNRCRGQLPYFQPFIALNKGPPGPPGPPGGGSVGPTGATGASFAANLWIIYDAKSPGINGGTFTSGAWRIRDLNAVDSYGLQQSNVTLGVNQFTIQPGVYHIEGTVPAVRVGNHKAALFNLNSTNYDIVGTSAMSTTASVTSISFLQGIISINNPSVYRIEHQCSVTQAVNGFGGASGFGLSEIYTQLFIQQLE